MKKHRTLYFIIIFCLCFPSMIAVANSVVGLGFFYPQPAAKIGEATEFQIWISDVENLYAFEIQFSYDPQRIQINSLRTGDFLEPGFVLLNTVEDGQAAYGMTQLNPSLPKSGNGALLIVNFTAIEAGDCLLSIGSSHLSNGNGEKIEYQTEDLWLTIEDEVVVTDTPTPTPGFTPTWNLSPTPTNTKIPTTQVSVVPSYTPTQFSTLINPQPTLTSTLVEPTRSTEIPHTPTPDSSEAADQKSVVNNTDLSQPSTTPALGSVVLNPLQTEVVMVGLEGEQISIPVSGEEALSIEQTVAHQPAFLQIIWWSAITFFSGLTLLFIYGIWANDRAKKDQQSKGN